MKNLINKLKTGLWHVAYRQKQEGSILTDRKTPFKTIPNTINLCAMDPFVFEYNSETYIFAEVYDALRSRGTIGYCKWDGKKFSKWKQVIIENYHLSYPFIFEHDGEIYIMPESFLNNDLHLYKALKFPDKWQQINTLAENVKFVDSTLFSADNKMYMFTYDISSTEKKLLLYKFNKNPFSISEPKFICKDDSVARPAGRVFQYQGDLIRVSQNCKDKYGSALVFSKINNDFWQKYLETKTCQITVSDIKLEQPLEIECVHTYNATAKFEVIDLKGQHYSLLVTLGRIFQRILKLFNA